MTLLYLDCFAGLAGDMMLGLLLDLGVSLDDVRADLASLPLQGYRLEAERVTKQGIAATKVHVIIREDPESAHFGHLHVHDPAEHTHADEPHPAVGPEHAHKHTHEHAGGPRHSHGAHPETHAEHGPALSLREIETLIGGSALAPAVRDLALRIFRVLGDAEAKAHGVPVEHIHFHEVGAIDSIVDIVGTAIGLARLGVDRIVAGPVQVGSGTIDVAHGRMPVPTPATAELLRGIPTRGGDVAGEVITPTGAAILRALAADFGPQPAMTVQRVGYGAGTRDLAPLPNVVRGFLGVPAEAAGQDEIVVLETNVDDMLPEHLGYVLDCLLDAGALDVFFTPVQGKKNRPATLITVLARDEAVGPATQVLFRETTTFGVRRRREVRAVLDRELIEAETPWGTVRVKVGRRDGAVLTVAPEYEECRRLAAQTAQPLRTVYDHAKRAALAHLHDVP